jgi:hypothetical protein
MKPASSLQPQFAIKDAIVERLSQQVQETYCGTADVMRAFSLPLFELLRMYQVAATRSPCSQHTC